MDKHAVLVELKRIASELGHAPSREEIRSHGQVSDRQIKNNFGTLTEALKAAGLKEDAIEERGVPHGEKVFARQVRQYQSTTELRQRFEQEIAPWVGKYDRTKDAMSMMVRSDDHAQWVDPWCDEVFWHVAQRMQPEVIVFGGDTADFWQISTHSKNPRRSMTLQSEIDFVVSHFFKKAREVCPNAQIDWLLGNHEMRLFRYLSDQAPGLASLRCLRFDELFKLKDYEINLVARPTFLNPLVKERENYKIYRDRVCVSHGTSTGQHPALAELKRYGLYGVSGHVHRHTVASQRDVRGMKTWITAGAMCQLKSGEEYIPDLVNWTQGFTSIHIHGNAVALDYSDLSDDLACIGGVFYKRSAKRGGVNQGLIADQATV